MSKEKVTVVKPGEFLICDPADIVMTSGLGSSVFVMVETTNCLFVWNAIEIETDDNFREVSHFLSKINQQRYGYFLRGFIINGTEHEESYIQKPAYRDITADTLDVPETNTFAKGLIYEFPWVWSCVRCTAPQTKEDFVCIDRDHVMPWAFSDQCLSEAYPEFGARDGVN
tara:strand:- start:266 stop:775 length:510 start_codon:yes stop_codon:yes gene_type:complete